MQPISPRTPVGHSAAADLSTLEFDDSFTRSLPADPEGRNFVRQVAAAAYSRVAPTTVSSPRLLAWSDDSSALLGLTRPTQATVEILAGNRLAPTMRPYAARYGGHQFGHWAGQLGDGRAITLGELTPHGDRWELQLKGAGPTPYSRTADGRAVLRSSVREFLCSEAMHFLGVPTTRALSLVATGDIVVRDMFYNGNPQPEQGAVVCRVAPSFVRFGNFEIHASRGEHDSLQSLADYIISQHFSHLGPPSPEVYAQWFEEICRRTAVMIAHWMRVGFVHGVMNTDNMSILGLTIDYGPYGWVDDYDPDWTPNTPDAVRRRYRFGQQPNVAWWKLSRLASTLSPLFDDVAPLQAGLDRYVAAWEAADRANVAAKLGLAHASDADVALRDDLHAWMREARADMTLTWR